MSDQDVLFSKDAGVATITLNRVSRHNALTRSMLKSIDNALDDIESDASVRVLVIRSTSPRFFCSGADINEWGDLDPGKMGSQWIRTGNRVFRRLEELDIPTLAVLSASALGGGFELALSCDLRYAASTAQVGFPEVSVGAIPGWLGCRRLIDQVGAGRAKELVLKGDMIDATTAERWGLINAVTTPEDLDGHITRTCELLRSRSSASVSVGKRLLRAAESGDAALVHEFAASVCKATPDAVEGVRAFREKRKPVFN
jgi:enoyl-CoA hydratase/carnithine racemase